MKDSNSKSPTATWSDVPEWAYTLAKTLLQALRERDPYTYGHSRRVARDARLLARAAGLSEGEQRVVEFASLFHDLGKLGVPDAILLKPARLTPDEAKIMRAHPEKSAEIISTLCHHPFFEATVPGIRHHHERMDGRGYPDGLIGDQIPAAARIILVCDTFDAMTTTRPYRKGLPIDVAYKELENFAGRQFDAQFVKIFLESHAKWEKMEKEITEEFITRTFRRVA